MNHNLNVWLELVLENEGGFVNDPLDNGGATNKGITLTTLSNYLGRSVSVDELKNISDSLVREIYTNNYWNRCGGNQLASGVDIVVADMAVNAGVGRAIKILQNVIGANPDGYFGPNTLKRSQEMDPADLIGFYTQARIEFYKSLDQPRFIRGWTNRANHTKQKSLQLIKNR